MDLDEKALYDHMLGEYRQALADSQFALAQANAQLTLHRRMLSELTEQASATGADSLSEDA